MTRTNVVIFFLVASWCAAVLAVGLGPYVDMLNRGPPTDRWWVQPAVTALAIFASVSVAVGVAAFQASRARAERRRERRAVERRELASLVVATRAIEGGMRIANETCQEQSWGHYGLRAAQKAVSRDADLLDAINIRDLPNDEIRTLYARVRDGVDLLQVVLAEIADELNDRQPKRDRLETWHSDLRDDFAKLQAALAAIPEDN